MRKIFQRTEKKWNYFFKLEPKIGSPVTSAAIAAKTKNPQAAQATLSKLK